MPKLDNEKMSYLVDAVVTCRDFCGDEARALADAAYDLGVTLSYNGIAAVMVKANSTYDEYRKEAGVTNPISADERVTVYKDLNSG